MVNLKYFLIAEFCIALIFNLYTLCVGKKSKLPKTRYCKVAQGFSDYLQRGKLMLMYGDL